MIRDSKKHKVFTIDKTPMQILRTPDHHFDNLPDYPFQPHYLEVDGLRIHYVDENPEGKETILMLHGEPTWSYLYRKMIPVFTAAGYRAIAPDLIGFGKSDKPASQEDYSYNKHVHWIEQWLLALDLKNITLVCQDWGGLIGLRIAANHPDRFQRITASNTFLPVGKGKPSEAFLQWQTYSQHSPRFNIGKIINGGCVSNLDEAVIAAYDAPFPDDTFKAGARIFPALVPTAPDHPGVAENIKAWEVLKRWNKPFMTAFSDSDPITKGGDLYFQKVIPGTQGQPHITIERGGHFVQEDQGEIWARHVVQWI